MTAVIAELQIQILPLIENLEWLYIWGVVIGAKPNLYCEAIELVCGGSPRICVLVEWKALDRVKSEL